MRAGRSAAAEALRSALDAGLALPWERLWRPVRVASAWVLALPAWRVLAALLLAQWLVVGIVAAIAAHNGVYYYTGGDATWYWTSAWVLAHGHVPQAYIGYGYPFLLAPFALIAGPSLVAGLPYAIGVNVLLLWPIALLCVYGIAKLIGGRGFAYLATLVWTIFPLLAIPYFYQRYHVRLIDQNLPSALGLIPTGDFPSLVALLAAAYFALRALAERTRSAAVAAGALTALAATVKPANLIFLPAPLVALALVRRWRDAVAFCLPLVPVLGGLALWKYRGLGYVPAFSRSAAALASGSAAAPVASIQFHRYVRFDWHHLWVNYLYLREYTWSVRMITWVLVAGLVALARRSASVAVLIGGWLAMFVVVKGTNAGVNVSDGSFFRYMSAAFPAFFFGLVAIVLLVPVFGRRLAVAGASSPPPIRRRPWLVLAAVLALALAVPLVALAAFSPLTGQRATIVQDLDQYVPLDGFRLTATVLPGRAVRLSWSSQDRNGARLEYAVYRGYLDNLQCTPVAHAATACVWVPSGTRIWSRRTTLVDRPGAGEWVYRVVATASPNGPAPGGDDTLFSTTATVLIPK